jgi:phosphomevalonate kinase
MSVSEKPDLSLKEASQIAEISSSSARLVFKEDLDLKPYKLPSNHELKPTDHP